MNQLGYFYITAVYDDIDASFKEVLINSNSILTLHGLIHVKKIVYIVCLEVNNGKKSDSIEKN